MRKIVTGWNFYKIYNYAKNPQNIQERWDQRKLKRLINNWKKL